MCVRGGRDSIPGLEASFNVSFHLFAVVFCLEKSTRVNVSAGLSDHGLFALGDKAKRFVVLQSNELLNCSNFPANQPAALLKTYAGLFTYPSKQFQTSARNPCCTQAANVQEEQIIKLSQVRVYVYASRRDIYKHEHHLLRVHLDFYYCGYTPLHPPQMLASPSPKMLFILCRSADLQHQ